MYCFVALSCLVAAVLTAPVPEPSPAANPLIIVPWTNPFQPFYLNPIIAPRSLMSWQMPFAIIPHNAVKNVVTQSLDHPDDNKNSYERTKRDVQAQQTSAHDVSATSGPDNTETHKAPIQKRQATAAFSPLLMPWGMPPLLTMPVSYAWGTQSFGSPSNTLAWSFVNV